MSTLTATPRASRATETRPQPRVGFSLQVKWRTIFAVIIITVFLVPVKRFTLPASLPFNLDPYRVLVGGAALAWLTSLMINPRMRIRLSGIGGPVAATLLTAVASIVANSHWLISTGLASISFKGFTFYLSFFILLFFGINAMRTRADIDTIIRVLVRCGVIVGIEILYEYRTGNNLFNDVGQVLPFLHQVPLTSLGLDPTELAREGSARAFGSAEDPIECSAVQAMLVPLGLYLFQTTKQRRWLLATVVIGLSTLGTLSRTGMIMLVVVFIAYLRMRRPSVVRSLPALFPALVVALAVAPHALGSIYGEFFPKGGIVAQQSAAGQNGQMTGEGDNRLARVGPDLVEWAKQPFFGEGFGSRINSPVEAAALHVPVSGYTDDDWLRVLLETGVAGTLALLWLFFRSTRRLKRIARQDDGPDGWLAVALIASIDAFMISQFTYDALGFVEVSIVFFVLLAIAWALISSPELKVSPLVPCPSPRARRLLERTGLS